MSSLSGILNINKPGGWTSHDVVGRVRCLLREKRVGHAGTLDPMATGVLLVCVGQATRAAEYLAAGHKIYRAEMQLGVTTDTYDADGEVVTTAPVPLLTADDLRRAVEPFVGEIQQRPPAYSAIKQEGVAAYRRARRGETVELASRPVTVHTIEILAWDPADAGLTMEITCGPGTYIRSLAHDLGRALGCGATLTRLARIRSGQFSLEDAVELDALADAARAGDVGRCLHPIEAALSGLTRVPVDAAEAARLAHGQFISCPTPDIPTGFAVAEDGSVVAILAYDAARAAWRPTKVFRMMND